MSDELAGHLIFAFGTAVVVGSLCRTLWSGELPIRGGPTYTRENDPVIFWIATTVLAIFAVVFVPIALSLFFCGPAVGPK